MPNTLTEQDRALVTEARRRLNNMASFVRRQHLTGWVKDRDASWQYRDAFGAVVLVEDSLGTDHPETVKLADRLRALYHEAQRARLLSPEQISHAERGALLDIQPRRTMDAKSTPDSKGPDDE